MKQYKVEITEEALQDMEDIYNYIAIDLLASENAMGQYDRIADEILTFCLLYTSPSPRDRTRSRMPSSA